MEPRAKRGRKGRGENEKWERSGGREGISLVWLYIRAKWTEILVLRIFFPRVDVGEEGNGKKFFSILLEILEM